MSSRRQFLGAAAAAAGLASTASSASADPDPPASNPGVAESTAGSPARITARVSMSLGEEPSGSASARSVSYRLPDAPRWEAELVLATRAFRAVFTLDREAATDLRDALDDDSAAGPVSGTVAVFLEGTSGDVPASIAVRGERLVAEGADVETVVATDEELRADLVDSLDAALADASVVDE